MTQQQRCPHARTGPRYLGKYEPGLFSGGPTMTISTARERIERSWCMCLDCGTRLERARVVQRDVPRR